MTEGVQGPGLAALRRLERDPVAAVRRAATVALQRIRDAPPDHGGGFAVVTPEQRATARTDVANHLARSRLGGLSQWVDASGPTEAARVAALAERALARPDPEAV